jgi:hypothetical protein
MEGDCKWCPPGKYQTGVGLIVEIYCIWCVPGKYQTGSGKGFRRIVSTCASSLSRDALSFISVLQLGQLFDHAANFILSGLGRLRTVKHCN